ncbi:thiamine diphosphokinase [Paracoccus laeviglucosivorans]|uniref:Thiamine diphosphokinase n=1 Tax=Paracoccus laeviglucosivorans TaxID=1197861 RepID=A0A521ANG0_9RHOB|nr:thiamine diphosphokinase [Paracoccus laeviglucosivorans]SMO36338.1 thiamine diphosphokinase [Paracoccus laeviglucosivorans]
MTAPAPALTSDRPVTLIGGGPFSQADLELALPLAPLVVAADGGADAALAHGLDPSAVIGDFDSLSEAARNAIPDARLHRVKEQESTDFQKCLSRIAAPLVLAVGFSGARQDHFLAALNALARRIGPPCILIAGSDLIALCPPDMALDLPAGARVSLFPMGAARGRSTGLQWPIDGLEFAPDAAVGTSNRATGPVTLSIQGPMLICLPRDCLAALIAALSPAPAR